MKKTVIDPIKTSIEILKESVKSLKNQQISSAISKTIHEEEVKLLAETIKYEKFFFVVDIINQEIKHAHGIKQWLGYDEYKFSFGFYATLIHPNYIEATFLLAKSTLALVNSNSIEQGFMKEKIVIQIALRHANGHYILVKHTISSWDYDSTTKVSIAYLNEFTILEEYDETEKSSTLKPRITDIYGTRLLNIENIVRESSYKILESNKRFSIQELRILRKYAYNPTITSNEVANTFKIKPNTIDTYNRRIISKFSYIYPNEKVQSAKEIAQFLRKECFI